ncbi:hypothetical protein FHX52_3175 [Humibacillus xanthopallidus]|uniref:Uncharacterized protein n=1 Tax=Humibacillus xanthopallidus TaxID=412689 RepID=A0A543PQW5_9MICO|nr:hypothetical protein [Humibacillus xanthopallidus]TQN46451.1 hypothetical protein FHX52_3175 [Humibacillus xanthopallidus]
MSLDQDERELRAMLHQRADAVDVHGDLVPGAVSRRRREVRTRAVAVAVVAAAAVAVAVPTLWSAQGPGPSPVPALPTTTAPTTPTPTTPTPTTPAPTRSTTASTAPAPRSGAIATRDTAYALDDTIRFGGTVLRLEKGTVVESFAVLANGGFVLQSHLSTGTPDSEIEILSPAGRTVRAAGQSGAYAVSPDGMRVLVKDGSANTVVVYAADGTVVGQRQDAREVGAIVGDVAYLTGDTSEGSLEWDVATGQTMKLPPHLVAVSPDRTRAALQWFVATDAMDDVCWAVVDLTKPTFPRTVERCGAGENPTLFMPTAFSANGTYLVGSHYVDGGFWFSAGVVRVTDGQVILGGTGGQVVSGWTWHLGAGESTFRISRNTSEPLSPATSNSLQACSLSMECTDAQPPVDLSERGGFTEARYVVPR